ncbi:endothiapepsin [Verticillium dahliae VdLs.17]|uniref:Endothiapepsin n=1 Tax=Verticillium dahliae (strain VdLs.17 / ATCC MYA-4575 / FGSC 10137) TaxID=498257 RepID=G2XBL5_VERDV|nr:endothiapepsin [Verticillium dahliae VdLs.17]EGY16383.1 endothiapepsin [Verticillium dahliae VdLs.17]
MGSFRVALATASVASCLVQAAAAMPKLEDRGIEARIPVTDRTGLHKEVWGATAFAATYARWSKEVPQSLRNRYTRGRIHLGYLLRLRAQGGHWIKAGDTSGNSVAYHPEKSETAIEIEDSEFRIHYADGDFAWGSVWLDTLELSPTLIVPNTSIGAATYMSDRLRADSVTTGLMGISKALEATTRPPTPTIIETLSLHLAPDQRFIGVDLRANSSAGQYTFGALPTRLYTSADVRWAAPVPASGHWDFGVSRFRLGAMAPDVWVKRPFVATADTGTTLLMLPRNVVEVYYSALPAAHKADEYGGAWVFPCADEAPDFEFWVGDGDGEDDGYRGRVPGAYVRYAPASHDDPDTCFGGIQDVELMLEGVEDKPDAIFGDVALKSMFVAFDIEEGRVGFADKELEVCSFDRSCQGNPLDAGELKGWGQ